MITVVCDNGHEIDPYDFKYPIYNRYGKIEGFSTESEANGNGTKHAAWCEIEMEPGVDLSNILGALESMIWDNDPPDKIED